MILPGNTDGLHNSQNAATDGAQVRHLCTIYLHAPHLLPPVSTADLLRIFSQKVCLLEKLLALLRRLQSLHAMTAVTRLSDATCVYTLMRRSA